MQDLNDKLTGNTLTAVEWNEVPTELQNVIEGLGITLSSGDLNQLGKAIAGYVANGMFYTDSGVADAYVLTTIGLKQSLTAYTDGAAFEFIATNANTGASTVNVATLGVKNIKLRDGTDPAAGQIAGRTILKFDNANDRCELIQSGMSNIIVFNNSDTYNPPAGVKSLKITATGAGGGAGGADGQGAGTGASSAGGGAGATAINTTNNIESSYTITIGSGGTGGAGTGGVNGTAGGNTTVVSTALSIAANGGAGGSGKVASSGNITVTAAGGGAATGGDVNLNGGDSAASSSHSGFPNFSSSGSSFWGGERGSTINSAGLAGLSPGSGGGPVGVNGVSTDFNGGAGTNGIVVIEERF